MFEELHQILLMDSGSADIAATIENMNLNIAKAQKIGLRHSKDKEQRL